MPELHESFVNRDELLYKFRIFLLLSPNILMGIDAINKNGGPSDPPSSNFTSFGLEQPQNRLLRLLRNTQSNRTKLLPCLQRQKVSRLFIQVSVDQLG